MKYRKFSKTGIEISEISLGAEHIEFAPYDEVANIVDSAIDAGVNYTDLFMGSPDIRDFFGRSLKGRRGKMMIAGHLGAAYIDKQYKRTRDMKLVEKFFEDLLARLNTDYMDMLMLHFIDDMDDWEVCRDGGMLDYAQRLKKKGHARMIGISTHMPAIASEAVGTGIMDGIMFSLNPLFDLMPADTGINELFKGDGLYKDSVGVNAKRQSLYELCEREGVGIIVMKAFAGGWLLNDKPPASMSISQCISYALSRPGVVTAACGCKSCDEFRESLEYVNSTREERDYAGVFARSFKWNENPRCLYCNHCLPCPAGIDIAGAMRRFYENGDRPEGCISCRICEERCPFGVSVADKFTI